MNRNNVTFFGFFGFVGIEPATPIEDQVFLLQEEGRPGEYMPAYEDEHGTYIMNSKDLRAIQHVQKLIDIGIDSLKIEGRTKSHFYVARTAQMYRRAIDDALAGKEFDMSLMDELESLSNRGYTEGFYNRHPAGEFQNYENGHSVSQRHQFVGEIDGMDDQGNLRIEVKNKFALGDNLELMTPEGNVSFELNSLISDKNASDIDVAPGSGHRVRIPMPESFRDQDMSRALLLKSLDRAIAT